MAQYSTRRFHILSTNCEKALPLAVRFLPRGAPRAIRVKTKVVSQLQFSRIVKFVA